MILSSIFYRWSLIRLLVVMTSAASLLVAGVWVWQAHGQAGPSSQPRTLAVSWIARHVLSDWTHVSVKLLSENDPLRSPSGTQAALESAFPDQLDLGDDAEILYYAVSGQDPNGQMRSTTYVFLLTLHHDRWGISPPS
jgi:hypothetical protein